jgi:hypothetical protein
MIIASEICTHCPWLSFRLFNEISCNKVVVPEGVDGLIFISSFLLVELSFTLNCYVVRFDMI